LSRISIKYLEIVKLPVEGWDQDIFTPPVDESMEVVGALTCPGTDAA